MKYLLNLSIAAFLAISLTGCIVIGNGDSDDDNWRSAQKENNELDSIYHL